MLEIPTKLEIFLLLEKQERGDLTTIGTPTQYYSSAFAEFCNNMRHKVNLDLFSTHV